MIRLFIFGMGYTSQWVAKAVRERGGHIAGTTRDGRGGSLDFADHVRVEKALADATHILSSVPPHDESDPVLDRYGTAIGQSSARWIGYFSSTGVYGDTDGAWVDESAAIGRGRRSARCAADLRWQALGKPISILRLPGIYGPGRSPFERLARGMAHRIIQPGQVFSRIHVEDIASGVIAAMAGAPGIYNLADDQPAPQNDVIAYAAGLIGQTPPPLQTIEEAGLSPAARAFYAENRRIANGKAKRLLRWSPRYPDYRAGLRALIATTRPASASAQPEAASNDQSYPSNSVDKSIAIIGTSTLE